MRRPLFIVFAGLAIIVGSTSAGATGGTDPDRQISHGSAVGPDDGAAKNHLDDHGQHGPSTGHLPGSSENVELLSAQKLTSHEGDNSDPTDPQEIASYDLAPAGPTGSDNWSAYWYEGPGLGNGAFPGYGTDGVHNPVTGRGFQVFSALVGNADFTLDHLNPQTQERVFPG